METGVSRVVGSATGPTLIDRLLMMMMRRGSLCAVLASFMASLKALLVVAIAVFVSVYGRCSETVVSSPL